MNRKKKAVPTLIGRRPVRHQPFDEADWVDWDHWMTVEEMQNFKNGLTDVASADEVVPTDSSDESRQIDHIARQIHRHGLEVAG